MVWTELFEDTILDRAQKYYKQGKVVEYAEDGGEISASVAGTDEYTVKIERNKDGIGHMECSCPYAADGNYCKHMAAVLYYSEYGEVTPRKKTVRKQKTAKAIEPQEECNYVETQGTLQELKKEVNALIRSYGYRGELDYNSAYDCVVELKDWLSQCGWGLIGQGRYKDAFLCALYAMERFEKADSDDDGELAELKETVKGIWAGCIEDSEKNITAIFAETEKRLNKVSEEEFTQDSLEEFFLNNFNDVQFAKKKLSYIDLKILEKKADGYGLDYYLSAKIQSLRLLNDGEELNKLRKEFGKYEAIQQDLLAEAKAAGNEAEMIKLLTLWKNHGERTGISRFKCHRLLMDIYKAQGDKEEYKREIHELIVTDRNFSLEFVKEAKELYTAEEWLSEREEIITAAEKYDFGNADQLYAEEEMYDRLMNWVENEKSDFAVKKYESLLKPLYEERLLSVYVEIVREKIECSSDRNDYKEIAKLLRRMTAYCGGREEVKTIIESCKTIYFRRKAMMEELKRIVY